MDKSLTKQFLIWLGEQNIHLSREDTSWVDPATDLDELMEAFINDWFAPKAIRDRMRRK
jgi:hypothetical protein